MKLNGWKRIGIVASIGWILGAYIYTFSYESAADLRFVGLITQSCAEDHIGNEVGYNECMKRGEDYHAEVFPSEHLAAAMAAFIPVPFAWGFVYLILFLARWIKRGFHG
jgi:hypothetical protein